MSFILHRGKTKIMWFKKSDTAKEVRRGSLVGMNDSGSIAPLRNDSTDRAIGVCAVNDTLTDTAFASDASGNVNPMAGMVPVEVPVESAVEWIIDTDSDGGAADTDVGRYCAVDTTGGNSVSAGDSCAMRVDISDTAIKQVFITGKLSSTKVIGVIARTAFNFGAAQDTTGV